MKSHFDIGVLLLCCMFSEHFSIRTLLEDCFPFSLYFHDFPIIQITRSLQWEYSMAFDWPFISIKSKFVGYLEKNSVMLESTNLSLIVGNSIAIVGDSLEYPFHHLLLPHEIHFQKEFFEGNLPFICPIVMTSWIRSVSTNICNW